MPNLEVLVATMKQENFNLIEQMNIRCSAIIANQHDHDNVLVQENDYGSVKMITTNTKGVGLNRNIALMASSAEILLFADDDITYYESSLAEVSKAFDMLPKADAIVFSVDFSREECIVEKIHLPIRRLHVWNAMRYGTCVLAVRRSSIIKKNITFHQMFGGGCRYNAGEDSLFILDCFKNNLHIYSHNYLLGVCRKDSSTWFRGFDKKYFHDKGAWFYYAFPKLKVIAMPLFALKMKINHKPDLSVRQMIYQMRQGVKSAQKGISYKEK